MSEPTTAAGQAALNHMASQPNAIVYRDHGVNVTAREAIVAIEQEARANADRELRELQAAVQAWREWRWNKSTCAFDAADHELADQLAQSVARSERKSLTALTDSMTEDELLQAITEAATYLGWRWFHIRRSDLAQQMGHSGFPDLCLARDGRVLFMELKAENGKTRPDQLAWLQALGGDCVGDAWASVVYPSQLDWALEQLK